MNIDEYIPKMKNIQKTLLEFLEKDDDYESCLHQIKDFIRDQNIQDQCLIEFIHLICNISQNHDRKHDLIRKIENILTFLKNDIMQHFTNTRLFNIFKNNRRILLFLIEEQFITIDNYVYKQLRSDNNSISYFEPELISYISKKPKKIDSDFEEKRRTGENDDYIFQLIREDSIEDFIGYVHRTCFPLSDKIEVHSIFETNSFLLEQKQISLIEYAAFFGSIQIFQYLLRNDVKLEPSLWPYAIHSNNAELINLLEENVKIDSYESGENYEESIKCYHNEIAEYIKDNLLKVQYDKSKYILFYNFDFITVNIDKKLLFLYSCKFDYYLLVSILINDSSADQLMNNILT